MEWTPELKERFLKTDPRTYGHYLGVSFMNPQIKLFNRKLKMIGPAYTVKLLGKDSCALYKALKEAPAGAIVVIDHSGDQVFASVGEMVARHAKSLKLGGIVTDGMATDSLWLEELDFPVFSAGTSVVTTNVWCVSGQYDIPISCGGAPVNPGDIIFGDADGVVVMNPSNYEQYIVQAEAAAQREIEMRKHFAEGKVFVDLFESIDRLIAADMQKVITETRTKK
jgi:regulator of RNase E activity RraA